MTSAPAAADLDIVRRIHVFRGVNPMMVERLIAPAAMLTLRQGATVFRQGDPATAFYILAEGWVKLYRVTVSGEEAVIHVFAKGDSIAEAVAFTGMAYPATAETVSEARLIRIPADHVIKCIRAMPDIALSMIAATSLHLHHLVQQVEQLKAQTGVQRVAEFLASLCDTQQGPGTIALPYDKALIAGRLGLKPESLSRAFAKLKPLGVEVRAAHVLVKDVGRLRNFALGERGSARDLIKSARV